VKEAGAAKGSWESEACSVPFSKVEEDENEDLRDLADEAEEVTGVSSVSMASVMCCRRARLVCACSGALKHAPHSLRSLSFRYLSLGGFAAQFRHTVLLHFLHSATRSLAQLPILLLFNSLECAPTRWSVNAER
jgi:hypothetical protein